MVWWYIVLIREKVAICLGHPHFGKSSEDSQIMSRPSGPPQSRLLPFGHSQSSAIFKLLLPIIGLALVIPACSQGQFCQPLLPLSGSPLQYKVRNNRCEGLYEQHLGAQALAIISLTVGGIDYPLKPNTILRLSVPSQDAPVYVRALAKSPSAGYEMDALIPESSTLAWPINDVLLPDSLGSTQIGVFAWKEESNQQIFMPISVSLSGSSIVSQETIFLMLRPSFDVQTLKWRWAGIAAGQCGIPNEWKSAVTEPIDAGQAITLPLPPLRPGRYCMDLAAQGSTSQWTTSTIQIQVPAV